MSAEPEFKDGDGGGSDEEGEDEGFSSGDGESLLPGESYFPGGIEAFCEDVMERPRGAIVQVKKTQDDSEFVLIVGKGYVPMHEFVKALGGANVKAIK